MGFALAGNLAELASRATGDRGGKPGNYLRAVTRYLEISPALAPRTTLAIKSPNLTGWSFYYEWPESRDLSYQRLSQLKSRSFFCSLAA
jgi:hypothetical protein